MIISLSNRICNVFYNLLFRYTKLLKLWLYFLWKNRSPPRLYNHKLLRYDCMNNQFRILCILMATLDSQLDDHKIFSITLLALYVVVLPITSIYICLLLVWFQRNSINVWYEPSKINIWNLVEFWHLVYNTKWSFRGRVANINEITIIF